MLHFFNAGFELLRKPPKESDKVGRKRTLLEMLYEPEIVKKRQIIYARWGPVE